MPKISYYQKKADKEFQKWFVKNYPKSEVSGLPTDVGHHFFPKSVASALRYEPKNMIPLTGGEHFRHHNGDPRIHAIVIQRRGMKWYKDLEKEKVKIIKPSKSYYLAIIEKYE